ncbi:MAG: hypothetical protein M3R67_02180 [Acidobacteriota bacterium]|nr:hypothetical protein [Acidobacteriota bacterium]
MNSFSDRSVLGEEDPDPRQSARNRPTVFYPPQSVPVEVQATQDRVGTQAAVAFSLDVLSLPPLAGRHPVTSIQSIQRETHESLANQRPARLAFELEARRSHFTLFTDVSHHKEHRIIWYAKLGARRPCQQEYRFAYGQTFQETTSTTWQKN